MTNYRSLHVVPIVAFLLLNEKIEGLFFTILGDITVGYKRAPENNSKNN